MLLEHSNYRTNYQPSRKRMIMVIGKSNASPFTTNADCHTIYFKNPPGSSLIFLSGDMRKYLIYYILNCPGFQETLGMNHKFQAIVTPCLPENNTKHIVLSMLARMYSIWTLDLKEGFGSKWNAVRNKTDCNTEIDIEMEGIWE